MPAAYAHYYFGEQCKACLPEPFRQLADERRSLWDYGVQGPDLLFYNLAPWRPGINRQGVRIHNAPGANFFTLAKDILKEERVDPEEGLLYTLAFISHFALDSTCHSYIERKVELSSLSHCRIEAQYDAHMLRLSGVEHPQAYRRANLMTPNRRDAKLMSAFLEVKPEIVLATMHTYALCLMVMRPPTDKARNRRYRIGKALPIGGHLEDLLMDNRIDEEADDSNMRLDKLRELALERFKNLSTNFLAFLNDEEDLLPYFFQRNFEKCSDYQQVPIFQPEEERNYTVFENGLWAHGV